MDGPGRPDEIDNQLGRASKSPTRYRMKTSDFLNHEINRRQFLGDSAKTTAGMAAGMVGLTTAVVQTTPAERVGIGVIGVRGQGKFLASSMAAFPDVEIRALCDVDESQFPAATKSVIEHQSRTPRWERDFRTLLDDSDIDAVVIATPDHWHALMTILACQAGKDVYVEKTVSHNVREGELMVQAASKHGRVVQAGMQQRSGKHFQSAIEYIKSGKLGTVKLAKAWTVHRRKSIGTKSDIETPRGVDYNAWLGPSPLRSFNPNRFHYNWHWFWDYGAGELGNWGVHMLDIARWGLGVTYPERIAAFGGLLYMVDEQETPDTLMVHYSFPGNALIMWEHRLWSTRGIEGRSAACAFYGDCGTLVVDRGGWKVYDTTQPTTSDTSDLARAHHRNFIDCIKTRSTPAADVEIGHVSSTLCHLGNIAYRVERDVAFDARTMEIVDDAQAGGLLSREYRRGWELPAV